MSIPEKHILIACYFFPPYPSIGGRRTAKFCKYLARKGYVVHVIGVENPYQKESHWTKEVQHENIRLYQLPLTYPKVLLMQADYEDGNRSLLNRILYKLTTVYYQLVQKKRIYDPTFLWGKIFRKAALSIIQKHNIKDIIVSAAPYYYAYYAALLKREMPELNYIIDFRDPWLGMQNFGMQEMSASQQKHEKTLVEETIRQANFIVSPSSFVLDEFESMRQPETLRYEITHAYDSEDVNPYLTKEIRRASDNLIRLVYGGSLYSDIEPTLQKLRKILDLIRIELPEVYKRLDCSFYVNEHRYSAIFSEHKEVTSFYQPIGKEIFCKVMEADFVLIFGTEFSKNFRTTKFYEYLPFQKPYFYIGPKGDTYHFIQKHQLGLCFENNDGKEKIMSSFQHLDTYQEGFSQGIDYRDFSLERQTEKLIQLFSI